MDSLDDESKRKLGEFSLKYKGINPVIIYISSTNKTLKLENRFDLKNERLIVDLENNFGKDCFRIN